MPEVTPSHKYKYLIVGGGIAGTTAAETLRKRDPEATICIVTDEPYRLYSRVLLSKPAFLTGEQHLDSAWMKTEAWYRENRIDLMVAVSAHRLDPATKTLGLSNGDILGYEKLLIAIGTHSRQWYIPGREKSSVHYLRTLDDAKGIIDDLTGEKKHAVMIGSACVSYEVIDILRSKGIEVTEVMREKYFWEPSLSKEEAGITEKRMVEKGVTIIPEMEVTEILGDEQVTGVMLKDGRMLPCDMVFAFIGIVLPTEWLTSSGMNIGRGIATNEYLETSILDVWAAGDCARYKDVVLDDSVMMGNWMNATKQGETAAANMAGDKKRFELVSFHSSHGFGDMISFAGDGRARADREYIMRGSADERKLGRLILRGNRIVGATMVNRTQELATIVKLIAERTDVSAKKAALADANFDLKTLLSPTNAIAPTPPASSPAASPAASPALPPETAPTASPSEFKKIAIGWFSFSCCEDSTIVFTELMNDHWQEWKKIFDFRNVRVLQSKNVMDAFDIAFIEGAIASPEHVEKLKDIRSRSKVLVAIGACAVTGLPSGQRANFTEGQKAEIQFLVDRFGGLPKVLTVKEVVAVDAEIPGCPMDTKKFLEAVTATVAKLRPELATPAPVAAALPTPSVV